MIILDTNVLPSGPTAGNVTLPVLRAVADELREQVALPRIVVEESCERLRRDVVQAHGNITKGYETIRSYLPSLGTAPEPFDHQVVSAWREELERNFQILEAPERAYEEAIFREARRQPPCKESGSGARDAVIWLTVVAQHHAGRGSSTYFVSRNKKDFGETNLRPELQAEIDGVARFFYCTSLDELLGRLARPSSVQVDEAGLRASQRFVAALRSAFTMPWFFVISELARPYFAALNPSAATSGGVSMTTGQAEIVSLKIKERQAYEVGGQHFVSVRCEATTTNPLGWDPLDGSGQLTRVFEIESEPLLLLQLGENDEIIKAEAVEQTRPLRLIEARRV